MTSVPVMSEGIRSGVNWMRLKPRWRVWARLLTISVFARPGTPTSRAWLRVKMEMRISSMTFSWPMMTLPSSLLMAAWAALRLWTAWMSASSGRGRAGAAGPVGWAEGAAAGGVGGMGGDY